MGCCLQMMAKSQQKPVPQVSLKAQPDTERPSLRCTHQEREKEVSVCGKASNIEFDDNSSVRETKIFLKIKSTALFSTDRSHSSIQQMTIDHDSMIIKDNEVQKNHQEKDFYTIADKVALLRKTGDCLKVSTPDGLSQLHCSPQHLFSVLTISEGKPVDCMEEVAPNKIIFNDSSPILLRIKLQCQACKKQLKISFCKGIVYIKTIDCPSCEKVGSWNIRDIECNYPIWGGGVKIDNHERIEPAPSVIRVMGCVCCFKFSNSNTMRCGCLLCSECAESSQISLSQQCWMCQERSYIL